MMQQVKKSNRRSPQLLKQRLVGVCLLLICAIVVVIALSGHSPAEKDATPVLLLAPLGGYLLFTRHIWVS